MNNKPIDKYTPEEKEKIISYYNIYLKEKEDKEQINKFIGNRLDSISLYIKHKTVCIYISLFGILNLIISIFILNCSNNSFAEDIKNVIIFLIFGFPFNLFIYYLFSAIKDKIIVKDTNRYDSLKNQYINLYEKKIYEEYEKYIKQYEEIEQYNKDKNEYLYKLKNILKFMTMERLSNCVKYILNKQDYKNINKLKGNYYEYSVDGYKVLVEYKKIERSISTADIDKLINKSKYKYDYCLLFYIGNISTNAVNLVIKKYRNKIILYDINDIAQLIYEYNE